MKKNLNVLFFGRKNDIYSETIYKYLCSLFSNTHSIWTTKSNEKIKINKLKNKKIDILIAFRSYYIFEKKFLSKIKLLSLNFHPGPPKYRGFGCANYALFNGDKSYGVTAHLIDSKIDHGKIIDVTKFSLKKNYDLNSLLKKTHLTQVVQCKRVIKRMYKLNFSLENYSLKYPCEEKWSKILKTKKQLDEFYEIDNKTSKKNFLRKLKSTSIENHKPYIIFYGKKFILK